MVTLRVGEWTIFPDLNRMSLGSETVQLEPLVMKALVYLAERRGEPVTRGELLDQVWEGTVVGDEALNRVISTLRRLFRDDPKAPRYLETIRHRGYRLVAEVEVIDESRSRTGRPRLVIVAAAVVSLGAALLLATLLLERGAPEERHHEVVPLTSHLGLESDPALSPDGALVAFSWAGEEGGDLDIYVKQIGAEAAVRVTRHPGDEVRPCWAPDGRDLAFIRRDSSGSSIFTVPPVGGTPRRRTAPTWFIGSLDWSPDGRHIVFSEMPDAEIPDRLVELDVSTGERRPLLDGTLPDGGDRTPAYSPDGQSVAFVRTRAYGSRDLFVAPARGGEPRRITRGLLGVGGLDWIDDESLISSAYANAIYSLWRVELATGEARLLSFAGEGALSPSVSRDTGQLVFQRYRSDADIWRVAHESGELRRVVASTYWDEDPSVSPDGKRLAFVSRRSGYMELWTADIDGTKPLKLTDLRGPSVARPRWSPDGLRLAFLASPDGVGDLFVVPADGGQPQRLTHGQSNNVVSGWSRDGEWIYFSFRSDGDRQIYKIDPDASNQEDVRRVTPAGGVVGVETADGRFFYYTRPGEAGLWRTPVAADNADELRVVQDLPLVQDSSNWALSDEGAFFVRRTEEEPELVFFDFSSASYRTITRFTDTGPPGISCSRDGQSVFFTRVQVRASDLMLVNDFR
jgi:Tol biopolymer transport system component/DNA-binding winged helix-turn-helix (wHTH) protein